MRCSVSFHGSISTPTVAALVDISSLWKQVHVERPPGRVAQEVAAIEWHDILTEELPGTNFHIGEAAYSVLIARALGGRRDTVRKNHPLGRLIEQIHRCDEINLQHTRFASPDLERRRDLMWRVESRWCASACSLALFSRVSRKIAFDEPMMVGFNR